MVEVLLGRFEDLTARGLRALIDDTGDRMRVVAEGVGPDELEAALRRLEPDVAVLNFGALPAPSAVRRLRAAHPRVHLVVLANRPSAVESRQILAFGASAMLAKDTQGRDVLNAIHLASRDMQVSPVADAIAPDILTPREADVLALLQAGRTNAEIAGELHLGVETVRTHARNVFRKLGVANRRELGGR